MKDLQSFRIVHGDCHWIYTGDLFQHLHRRWIIMTEYIEFHKRIVNRLVIKMCGYNIAACIICWPLNGSKLVNVKIFWYYHKATGMLTCCSFNPRKSISIVIHFGFVHLFSSFLNISFHKSISRPFGYR